MSDDLGDIENSEVLRHLFPGSSEGEHIKTRRSYSLLVEPKDFENLGRYKYVVFEDGKVLFCSGTDIHSIHLKIVRSRPTHKGISAGTIKVKDGKWAIVEGGSTSAKLPRGNEYEDHILKALCPLFIYDIEVMYGW